MQRTFFLSALCVLWVACTPEGPAALPEATPFYDLNSYMVQEIDRLETTGVRVTKSITLNGVTETKKLDSVNFNNDLRLFREADINKPAWADKYTTELKQLSGSHKLTTYLAQDSSLIVRRLMVEEDLGVTTKIEIDRKTGTVLSSGTHHLVYEPAVGYRVQTSQQNRFGKDVEALIEVKWE